ncbi:hypothetical protein [Teredinibacter purpureus]|uniref:hypothetical protein n=1 Tax=Teredinibacter purpureus TaxID=2731756 RepID=UPI0005F8025F|nr:hypothetical protein [Teredinibacter purpureus]
MKNIFIFIGVFIAACTSGVITSIFVTMNQNEAILVRAASIGEVLFSPESEQSDFEIQAGLANNIVEYVNNDDFEGLLSLACINLMFSAEELNPEVWKGANKYKYAVEVRDKSMNNLIDLRKRGYCE